MSSINIPLGASSKPYTLPGGGSSTAVSLEVKKGPAGLEVTAHGRDSEVTTPLEVTAELRTFLEAVGVRADTDFATLDMESVNASVLRTASSTTGIPDLQA